MRRLILPIVAACILLAGGTQAQDQATTRPAGSIRFACVDVFIDSGQTPLAAYQFELKAPDAAKIVGVESGRVKGFQDPPYYDPAALQKSRIIVGAFNTSADVPSGKVHAARVHFAVEGDVQPQYSVQLTVAGNANGEAIAATISFAEGAAR